MRIPKLSLLALAAPALISAACGKEENTTPPSVVEFPHAFPEAPRAMVLDHEVPAWTSGHGMAATQQWLYVTDRDNKDLVRLNRETLAVDSKLALGGKPEQVVVGPDGAAYVTVRTSGDIIRVVDMQIDKRLHLGAETYGVALSDDGYTLYVTAPREQRLFTVDAETFEKIGPANGVETLDEPRGLAVVSSRTNRSMGTGFVTVVHQHTDAMEYSLDEDGLIDDQIVMKTAMRKGNPADNLTQSRIAGLQATRALAATVMPETGTIFMAHVVAAPGTEADFRNAEIAPTPDGGVTTPPSDGGYGSTAIPGVSVTLPTRPVEVTVTGHDNGGDMISHSESEFPVKDPATGENMLALVDQPSDVVHHPTHTLLFMAGYGTDNVLVMSTSEGDPTRSPVGVISVGQAPRAIAISPDGQKAYVLNEFELSVSVIDLAPFLNMKTFSNPGVVGGDAFNTGAVPFPSMAMDSAGQANFFPTSDMSPDSPRTEPIRVQAAASKAYAADPMPAQIRRGARVYTFSRNENISHAGQFACASCHLEGHEDKLTWFIPDGPRQTPSLAGRLLGTAPFNWNGTKEALQGNMVQTVERMGGKGLTTQEIQDLEQFLLYGLEAPQNPYLAKNGELTAQQEEGKEIFNSEEAKCGTCHRPDQNFTDGFSHDVGTSNKLEVERYEVQLATGVDAIEPGVLNTPTLKGLFYTAPYLHDGSAQSLRDVLERTKDTMGKTSHLTEEQKDALVAYLQTL